MAWTYTQVAKAVASARDPGAGKPLGNNTRAFRRGADRVAVRFHWTDIVTYFEDGRIIVNTAWCDSPTTRQRINEYAGLRFHRVQLPLYNGRKPSPSHLLCVRDGDGWVPAVGKHSELEFDAEGRIVLHNDTKKQIRIVTDPKRLTQISRRMSALCRHLTNLEKLGLKLVRPGEPSCNFEGWLVENVDVPLEKVDFISKGFSGLYYDNLRESVPKAAAIAARLAQSEGLYEGIQIQRFERKTSCCKP